MPVATTAVDTQSGSARAPVARVGDGHLNGGTNADNWSSGWPELALKGGDRKMIGWSLAAIPTMAAAGTDGSQSVVTRRSPWWLGQQRRRYWRQKMAAVHRRRPCARRPVWHPISGKQHDAQQGCWLKNVADIAGCRSVVAMWPVMTCWRCTVGRKFGDKHCPWKEESGKTSGAGGVK